jgi:hypothetical protein
MDNVKDFISLTEKEIEKYKNRPNEIAQVLVDKALLYEAKQAERTEAELKEMDFLQENALVRFYVQKKLDGTVAVTNNEIQSFYNANRGLFANQNESNSDNIAAQIYNFLYRQKLVANETKMIQDIISNFQGDLVLSNDEVKYMSNNSVRITAKYFDKIMLEEMKKEDFLTAEADEIEEIKDKVQINYYIEKSLSGKVNVTEDEVKNFHEMNKESFLNFTIADAYTQIYNFLFQQKINNDRLEIMKKVVDKYKLNDIIKEYDKKGLINLGKIKMTKKDKPDAE